LFVRSPPPPPPTPPPLHAPLPILPAPVNPPSACRFHPRCPRFVEGHCDVEDPPLYSFGNGHVAACHYALERWPMGADEIRRPGSDRKSTRLNSSHRTISYAVFCLK